MPSLVSRHAPFLVLFFVNGFAHAESAAFALEEVTVTGTREARRLAETPQSVDKVSEETLRAQRPSHPSQVMNQAPGVWVSNLSGEGHSTAIRQPLTTNALYLYLEDGIPSRSTGFFNHNSLYEINVPQSGGIEISKGPATALYGSDSIGGTVNVLTRKPPQQSEAEASLEAGSFGWKRLLASGGSARADDAWRASLNLTHNDGWQEAADYDRQSGNFRWDHSAADMLMKTVLAFTQVDQRHVGSLNTSEYNQSPRGNNIPFSYRKVEAVRLSTAVDREWQDALLSLTPYLRDNRMEIVPSWTVSYDPNRYTTANQSMGVLAKYRRDFAPLHARLIAGVDFDYSPGSHDEDSLRLIQGSNALGGRSYRLDPAAAPVKIYNYDVTYRGISPYVHGEFSPLDRLRVSAGLRYDDMQYDYENKFNAGAAVATQGVAGSFPGSGWYGHAASTSVGYHHLGPKLGATYGITAEHSAFVAYGNSFRAPSESQVFRGSRESTASRAQTAAESLLHLRPVIADNFEAGLRGRFGAMRYEAALYYLTKKDDIVSYTDPATNQRTVVNAGKTLHRGFEGAIELPLASEWRIDTSLSIAKHSYEKWVVSGTVDYSGKEMESAPRLLANTRLSHTPAWMNGGRVQLEWFKLGSYWQDQANTLKYAGHDLFHLRANYPVTPRYEVWAAINNLLDKRYAETAGVDSGKSSYTAGLPRNFVFGLQAKW